METVFISNIIIKKVRHLKNIELALPKNNRKHIIFTGKNGSGKTSVLDCLSRYLNAMVTADEVELARMNNALSVKFNEPEDVLRCRFEKGQFILAYYKAERLFKADIPKHIEKVDLKDNYAITEEPRQIFIKYLLDLKVTEALSRTSGKIKKTDIIKEWFIKFESLLRKIFDEESLELIFEEDTFKFFIKENNREPFDFNSLSSGFAAVLDIVLDIIVRMEKATDKSFDFNISGIVLIDEIETHLHLELQKTILELLTSIFPNIQFIVSTHSPFVLNSLDNVMIYDLENKICVADGLSNVPYGEIVGRELKDSAATAIH